MGAQYLRRSHLGVQSPPTVLVLAPTKYQLVINMKTARKTARALGSTVPQSLLARVDEAIE